MELLKNLYRIASPSGREKAMQSFIREQLSEIGASFYEDASGNIYATKGVSETYPCIVAHMDEVHRRRKNGFTIITTKGLMFGYNTLDMEQVGIGADDKNGIWVCLKAMQKYDNIKCAFFVSEETGCQGSYNADMSFFDDCRFVLQCDRRGSSDFITIASCTELCSAEFLNDIKLEAFGYYENHGAMTDVMALKESGLNISAANISCGYYNPHTNQETTCINDLENCFNLVCWIIENCTKVYVHYSDMALNNMEDNQEIIEELSVEMAENPMFNEQDFIDFYNYYKEWYDISYDSLHDAFLSFRTGIK